MNAILIDESKPETVADALARWDAGGNLWTVEMGGLGPGYEQAIQVTAFEFMRELLTRPAIDWAHVDAALAGDPNAKAAWRAFTDDVDAAVTKRLHGMGLSGAQVGAAQNMAYIVMRKGYRAGIDSAPPDRLIQVSKHFPALETDPSVDAVDPHGDSNTGTPSTRD